jgi:DNA primase
MKYPKEYLDEIKLRLKVSQVVGKFVQLKKRGKEFIGLSPFKNEKSPSFTVSDEKEFYHCFSTGEHGNIFDFLMKTKSVGFGEAVKILAVEAGMQPYRFSNFDEKREKKFQTYKNIYHDYKNFFHKEIFDPKNSYALQYFEKRGLTKKIIEEFKLGYVPWKNNFHEKLSKKYSTEDINMTGLYYKSDKTQNYIDRFNSRIIFPVNNLTGETIAFGGRIIKESKLAKYINSPETDFYKKGRIIFNLDNAKSMRSETKEVIVVEGYMDVVSLHSAGIKNVISNSGTALTEIQIELIWKFFSNPIICLDGDKSGQNAATRIAEKLISLINENNKIYFSIMKEGEDPDDYIKKNGKANFIELLKSKKIIQSYLWDIYSQSLDVQNPFETSKFEKKVKNICYSIKDETLRKYILEEYLLRIKNLTPMQNTKKIFNRYAKKDYQILNRTKEIFNQKNKFTKEQLKEFSILFIMINSLNLVKSKIKELSDIKFSSEINEELKNNILQKFSLNNEVQSNKFVEEDKYIGLIEEVKKNTKLINLSKKSHNEKAELLEGLLEDLKEMNHLKKIQFLENKVAENLDEGSYSELLKLKSQINRE